MNTVADVVRLLSSALGLGKSAQTMNADTPLLGGLAEFDSMAVVTVVGLVEDEFGLSIDDDELSAEVFATVGSLAGFIEEKRRQSRA
jgi:acyl carrier protein